MQQATSERERNGGMEEWREGIDVFAICNRPKPLLPSLSPADADADATAIAAAAAAHSKLKASFGLEQRRRTQCK